MECLKTLYGWGGVAAWLLVLIGYLLQRKAQQARLTQSNKATILGSSNSVAQTNQVSVDVPVPSSGSASSSRLETWANRATLVGLVVGILSLLNDLIGK